MIDVLHVISGLGMGGAEAMLVRLAAALRARGLSQHVISLSGQDALVPDLRAAEIGTTVLKANSFATSSFALASLVGTVSRLRPRILQGWMYHGNIAATLCHYACLGRRRRKLYWNLRASNMDDARYGRTIWLSSLLSGLPDAIIANSEAGVAFHRARGFRARRVMVIDNGIDTERFRPGPARRAQMRAELGIPAEAVVVIHVARVDPMKDHATFLAAMKDVPSAVGLMVGEGTLTFRVPPNVRALGRQKDTAALYAAADIVASSSAFGEGFSNVIAEGMSAGLVPVATDVGDARRIVGDMGTVVTPDDPAVLAKAIAEIVALTPAERSARGTRAREQIVDTFSLQRAVDAYHALYSN